MNAKSLHIKRSIWIMLYCLCAVMLAFAMGHDSILAGTGSIYFNPANVSAIKDNSFSITLRINPGANVTALESTTTYDTSKLELISIDVSSSPFGYKLMNKATGNTIRIDQGDIEGVSNDVPIAVLTFKAKVSSGSSAINLAANSAADGVLNPTVTGATVNFSAPANPTSPATNPPVSTNVSSSQTNTSSNKSTNNTATTKTPAPTATQGQTATPTPTNQPSSSALSVVGEPKSIEFTKASFTISCNTPSKAWIKFGLGDNLSFNTAPMDCKNTSEIKLDEKFLLPGLSYNYRIVSQDQNGNIAEGDVQTFNTKGYTVKITVLDKNNKPLKKQKVTLRSEPITTTTDGKGVATFENVTPGKHKLIYSQNGIELSQDVTVEDNILVGDDGMQYADPQNISVIFGVTAKPSFNYLLLLLVAAILLIAIVVMVFLFKIKKHGSNKPTKYDTPLDNGTNNMNNPNIGTVANDAVIQAQRPDQIVSPQVKNYEVKNDDIV